MIKTFEKFNFFRKKNTFFPDLNVDVFGEDDWEEVDGEEDSPIRPRQDGEYGDNDPYQNTDNAWVYSILTKKVIDSWNRDYPISIKNAGYHFFCETYKELKKIKKQFPLHGNYHGSEIVDVHISRESEGMAI